MQGNSEHTMRLGQFMTKGGDGPWVGAVVDDSVVHLERAGSAAGIDLPGSMRSLLEQWEWKRKVELTLEHALDEGEATHNHDELHAAAPVLQPEKIVAVGLNYRDHAIEGGNEIPDSPVIFTKFPPAVNAPGQPIEWDPTVAEQVDYEAELVVVIGRTAREVDRDEAWESIAGFTVGNDVSARDLQYGDGQWVRGKSLDTFAPIGPTIVTRDEIDDPHDLEIWAEVNGERLQESSTSELIFQVDELVSFISQTTTLRPGDLLFTGTPPGVGVHRDPPVLLSEGDEVTIGIDGIGTLTNPCQFRGNDEV